MNNTLLSTNHRQVKFNTKHIKLCQATNIWLFNVCLQCALSWTAIKSMPLVLVQWMWFYIFRSTITRYGNTIWSTTRTGQKFKTVIFQTRNQRNETQRRPVTFVVFQCVCLKAFSQTCGSREVKAEHKEQRCVVHLTESLLFDDEPVISVGAVLHARSDLPPECVGALYTVAHWRTRTRATAHCTRLTATHAHTRTVTTRL